MSMITKMNEALKAWMKSDDREMFGTTGPLTLQESKMFEFAFSAGYDAAVFEMPQQTGKSGSTGYQQSPEHRERIRQGVLAAIAKRNAEAGGGTQE